MKKVAMILFILVLASVNLSSCFAHIIEEANEVSTIEVNYKVIATSNVETISVTYTNPQGGVEQINGLKPEPFNDLNVFTVANYEDFPEDEFIYLSAQNECEDGWLSACIMINHEDWKSSKAQGGYAIATASGYYSE